MRGGELVRFGGLLPITSPGCAPNEAFDTVNSIQILACCSDKKVQIYSSNIIFCSTPTLSSYLLVLF
uniref:Uncharacterized protein n=1 Tax=Parascaris equorum TaxID=6256 RepID=A0A914R129_PAREQ